MNAFSITTYYLSRDGRLEACNSAYSACRWSEDSVHHANERRQATGAVAQPLVFANSGITVEALRALVARPDGIASTAALLRSDALRYGYRRVQFDLEPSCWEESASACAWPRPTDAINYVRLVNATADALAEAGATLSIAVGVRPEAQCDSASQHAACVAAGDSWTALCENGTWSTRQCNCCAFSRGLFRLPDLCRSRAAAIVNMDTYHNASRSRHNSTAFRAAVAFYAAAGCTGERQAVGLLAEGASTSEEAATVVEDVMHAGAREIDIWSNVWSNPTQMAIWSGALATFLAPDADRHADSPLAAPPLEPHGAQRSYGLASNVRTAKRTGTRYSPRL